ncbi:protein ALTERED XYLOGLUCAN 9 isoform X1 [Lotus japonicus]|uniref:protein ALTERED XYLOGLUCAN 9 isoform X1 n=1 Tax=Lotus japonicus TaxID=34305 RepID=UPI00258E2441|nr:protein ALTERED XYLOGLUCAN 9 isoform X1 [Lotus japonicus]
MLGAVQLGLLAACVVLFVPMGMAGWHLSRNKVLFFSGALFITLAVGVHLTPYFPSVSDFITSVSSSSSSNVDVVVDDRDSCVSLLHEIDWEVRPSKDFDLDPYLHNNSVNFDKFWSWRTSSSVDSCDFQRLKRHDVLELLNGSWVMVAGDSQARMFTLSLISLVLDSERVESVRASLFKRHSDYHIVVDEMGMKLDFIWAPYPSNLTDLVVEFKHSHVYPDLLVMGSGLWHMLHMTNASDYGVLLRLLRSSVTALLPVSPQFGMDGPVTGSVSVRSPHLFWLGMPTLINSMLNTQEKRVKMTNLMRDEYESELQKSNILRQFGGPLQLLDIGSLSWNCGIKCTDDGMHYDGAVYEAGLQIMLNALLIESHQKL